MATLKRSHDLGVQTSWDLITIPIVGPYILSPPPPGYPTAESKDIPNGYLLGV